MALWVGAAQAAMVATYPTSRPTSDNDLTTSLQPFTYARTGVAWEYNAAGVLTSYAAGVAPFPAYPLASGTNLGIGFWLARVNALKNSETPTTQSLTFASAGTRVSSLVGSGTMAVSAADSGGNAISLACTNTNGGTLGGTPASTTVTQAQFCSYFVPANTTVTYTMAGNLAHVQDEACFTTSVVCNPSAPIVTTTVAVTRNLNTLSAPLPSFGLGATEGSLLFKFRVDGFNNQNQTVAMVHNGTANTGYHLYINNVNHQPQLACEAAGVIQASALNTIKVTAGSTHYIGMSYRTSGGMTVTIDGQAFTTNAAPCNVALTTLSIGSNQAGALQLQGYESLTSTFAGKLPDSVLQAKVNPPSDALKQAVHIIYYDGQSLNTGRRGLPIFYISAPYPAQIFMPNDPYGAGGLRTNNYYISFGSAGITNIIPAFEAAAVYPPAQPTDFQNTGIVATAAEEVYEGSSLIYMVRSNAAGAQTLAQLSKGYSGTGQAPFNRNAYQNNIDIAANIAALTAANGGSSNVDSIDMDQGESDRLGSGTPTADYYSRLNALINNTAADLGQPTGKAPIWYFAQLAASGTASGTGSNISLIQADIALYGLLGPINAAARFCVPKYVFRYNPVGGDSLHLDGINYDWKGEFFGHCHSRERANSGAKPLYPLNAVTLSTTILPNQYGTIPFNVPKPPLQFDTTSPIQGAAYAHGLEWVDACTIQNYANGQPPYTQISSVMIGGDGKSLNYTLSAPYQGVSACPNPRIQLAYNGPAVANNSTLPSVGTAGAGGTPGSGCALTTVYDTAGAQAQATYSATVASDGTLATVDSITYPGLYPRSDIATLSKVPVTGCGLTGATISGFQLTNRFLSGTMSEAWTDIRDSDNTLSKNGRPLYNWPPIVDLPVTLQ